MSLNDPQKTGRGVTDETLRAVLVCYHSSIVHQTCQLQNEKVLHVINIHCLFSLSHWRHWLQPALTGLTGNILTLLTQNEPQLTSSKRVFTIHVSSLDLTFPSSAHFERMPIILNPPRFDLEKRQYLTPLFRIHLLGKFVLNFKAIHEIIMAHEFVQYRHSVITNLYFLASSGLWMFHATLLLP